MLEFVGYFILYASMATFVFFRGCIGLALVGLITGWAIVGTTSDWALDDKLKNVQIRIERLEKLLQENKP